MKATHLNHQIKKTLPSGKWAIDSLKANDSEEKNHFEGTFCTAIWPVLVAGQIFGILPVKRVRCQPNIFELQFKWKSKLTLYTLMISVVCSANFLWLVWKTFTTQAGLSSVATLIYYGTGTFGMLIFFKLATKWPQLMKFWTDAEQQLPSFHGLKEKRAFIYKIRFISFGFIILFLVENVFEIMSQLHFVKFCEPEKDPLVENIKTNVPHIYNDAKNISIFDAFFAYSIVTFESFIWNYWDVFLILIGMALTSLFKLFNDDLKRFKGENMSQGFWISRRNQYIKLCDLVKAVDDLISHFILLSFANNFVFICTQLFFSLRPLPTVYRVIYFWYSLLAIILRTCVVTFSLASINDESKKPIDILRAVPFHSWNTSTDRFLSDVINNDVALSGMRFFFITRKLMLSVTGTIATYELVMMQFNLNYEDLSTCKSQQA